MTHDPMHYGIRAIRHILEREAMTHHPGLYSDHINSAHRHLRKAAEGLTGAQKYAPPEDIPYLINLINTINETRIRFSSRPSALKTTTPPPSEES